jgi:hypothetical protein
MSETPDMSTSAVDDLQCGYCAGPLGTTDKPCCGEPEQTPYSIGFERAWQQGQNRLGIPGYPAVYGSPAGWCCGRWLLHHDDIDRHLREMHNVGAAR